MKQILVILMALFILLSTGSVSTVADIESEKVIIKYKRAISANDEAFIKKIQGKVGFKYHSVNALAAEIPSNQIARIKYTPEVLRVERDIEAQILDMELDSSWGVKKIQSDSAWASNITGQGITVAIIDTGVDYTHPDLDGNYLGGYDFVNRDSDPMDDAGHGTHVAGIIAAENNGIGVVGVAPEVKFYALKVFGATGSGFFSDVMAAIQWVIDKGDVKITSNSYGGNDPGQTVKEMFDVAYQMGILSVAATGNSGNSGGTGENTLWPANFDSVVAVSAINGYGERAYFSSTGSSVEVTAPGVDIDSTYPRNANRIWSGTSMAAPHVSGVAALVWDKFPTLSNIQVRNIINQTADDVGEVGKDSWYGYGLVNAAKAIGNQPNLAYPSIISKNISSSTSTSVQLNADIVSSGSQSQVYFVYGNQGGVFQTPIQLVSSVGAYSAVIGNLSPSVYYYRAILVTSEGTFYGGEAKFFPGTKLAVTTDSAEAGIDTATLYGTLQSMGVYDLTVWVQFEIGLSPGNYYGLTVSRVVSEPTSYQVTIGGLSENTTYYYIASAFGQQAEVFGVEKSFTTQSNLPPPTTPPTTPPPTPPTIVYMTSSDTKFVLSKNNRLIFNTVITSEKPVYGASVSVKVVDPSGKVSRLSDTTDASGASSITIKGNAMPGTWTAEITQVSFSNYIWDKENSDIDANIDVPRRSHA